MQKKKKQIIHDFYIIFHKQFTQSSQTRLSELFVKENPESLIGTLKFENLVT